jgi:serine/threonine-protein kinase
MSHLSLSMPGERDGDDLGWFVTPPGGAATPGRAEEGRRVGRYRLIEPLGAGGQAVVWRSALLDPPGGEVALKVLTLGLEHDRRRVARLRREASRVARLDHPSLLHCYEFGVADGAAFMAMPLIAGPPLADVLAARRREGRPAPSAHRLARLPEDAYLRAAVLLISRIARALHAAHAARIAHRDVKPANILLDREGDDAYLIDFGLARDLDVATAAQLRDGAGTPVYMAPEKLLGRADDELRCDIYALGVTLFEATVLERPFAPPEDLPRPLLAPYLAVWPSRSPRAPATCGPTSRRPSRRSSRGRWTATHGVGIRRRRPSPPTSNISWGTIRPGPGDGPTSAPTSSDPGDGSPEQSPPGDFTTLIIYYNNLKY